MQFEAESDMDRHKSETALAWYTLLSAGLHFGLETYELQGRYT